LDDKNIKDAEVQQFHHQPKEFIAEGSHEIVHQWDTSLNAHGDYFNGLNSYNQSYFQTVFIWLGLCTPKQ
jgi:hypothetical protein